MAHRSVAAKAVGSGRGGSAPHLVLASEALRDDVAPREPGAQAARFIVGGIAFSFALLGLAMRLGADATRTGSGSSVAFAAAGAAAGLAALPFPYSVRAIAAAMLGGFLMLLGIEGTGPLAGLALGGTQGSNVARMLALGVLPGALLFRARYRAYPRARLVLGVGLIAALPFAASRALMLADAAAPLFERAPAALSVAVILAGLFGFMGEDTTAGGSVWAGLVLFVLPGEVAFGQLDRAHQHLLSSMGWLTHGGAAVGTAGAATLLAIGGYQALAAWLGADARRAAGGADAADRAPHGPKSRRGEGRGPA
jgi:hypothetical protein